MDDETADHKGLGAVGKLNWMYDGPSALVDREDYLLGRKVDKSLQYLEEAEKGNGSFNYADEVEKDLTPVSLFAPKTTQGPVDVIRKIKEDPLYQIQKKEEENMRELLKNPVKMKHLQEMVEERKRANKKNLKHKKKKSRRRDSSSDSSSSDDDDDDPKSKKEIDKLVSEKLRTLKQKLKGRDSPSSSSSDDERRKKKYKKDNYSKPSHSHNSSYPSKYRQDDRRRDDYYDQRNARDRDRPRERERDHNREDRDRRIGGGYSNNSNSRLDDRRDNSRPYDNKNNRRGDDRFSSASASSSNKKIDEDEKAKKLAEMMDNAKWRDEQRTTSVNKFREEQKAEEEAQKKKERDPEFINKHLLEAANSGSVEKRIKSNSYNIQRSKGAMEQNFARR